MSGDLPSEEIPIIIYDQFPADWKHLTGAEKAACKALLRSLQSNPYSPELQRKCILHEDELFEYPLTDGRSIFWKVRHPSLSITELNMEVLLVAIDRTSRSTRKK